MILRKDLKASELIDKTEKLISSLKTNKSFVRQNYIINRVTYKRLNQLSKLLLKGFGHLVILSGNKLRIYLKEIRCQVGSPEHRHFNRHHIQYKTFFNEELEMDDVYTSIKIILKRY